MEKRVSFSQFQKLGKVLMTPVMILPIAGILVGIGSAFTTKNIVALWPVLGNTYVKLFFNLLKAMGNTINSYLPIIFAVSVAIGYAEKEKGIAALSSVIGFLAMNNVMNILLTSLGILDSSAMKTGQSMVMGIASLDTGVFGGILVGLLVAKLHNKYYNIQLPPVLGIFSGTKFVPMISLLACSALGLVMSVVWPFVQTALGAMGEIIYDTGMAGSVIYGVTERALLPFGLHHFIYTPFFFTNLGGSMVIDGTLYEGAVNIYNAMLASPDAMFDVNITRFIMNGKVIFAMFGLPGAALAMYHTAKPERKPQVKALLIAANRVQLPVCSSPAVRGTRRLCRSGLPADLHLQGEHPRPQLLRRPLPEHHFQWYHAGRQGLQLDLGVHHRYSLLLPVLLHVPLYDHQVWLQDTRP